MMQGSPAGSAMAALWGSVILSAARENAPYVLVYQLGHIPLWGGAGAGGLSGRGHDYRRECPHCDCVYPAQSRLFVSDLYHWFAFFF